MNGVNQMLLFAVALTAGLAAAAQPMSKKPVGTAASTDDGCMPLPKPAAEYVNRQTGWHVLTLKDLIAEDQVLWSQRFKGQCPGIVRLNFDGTPRVWYALALVRQAGDVLHERLELLDATDSAPPTSLTKDRDVSGPLLIFKAEPGDYTDVETGKKVVTRYDGVIVEKMESADHLFCLSHGRIQDIMLSD